MSNTRTMVTATPLYPGSFVSEEGSSVVVNDADVNTVLAAVEDDGRWFAVEVTTSKQKRWTDDDGGEMWTTVGKPQRYRIYLGEKLTIADVEQLPGEYSILLSNMRSNGWDPICRTRRGNFQPIEPGDVVKEG